MSKFKHLSQADRFRIESLLNEGASFKEIGRKLERYPNGIREEIKRNSTQIQKGAYARPFNNCINRFKCEVRDLCENCNVRRTCKFCASGCYSKCEEYKGEDCPKLRQPPYVCNNCSKRQKCTLEKNIYKGKDAQRNYEFFLSQNKQCVRLSQREIKNLENVIQPLLKQGQSLHHICASEKNKITVCERTIYSYIDKCVFEEVGNLDLPLKVRYRPRKTDNPHKVDSKCREGRTLEDYLVFTNNEPDYPTVQMDSVIGVRGGKVLLTLHFTDSNLMLAFLRDSNNAASVIDVFNSLEKSFSLPLFRLLFPCCLGDNGSEFSNPLALELSPSGKRRTNVFYCNPSSPEEKGSCEKNHVLLRRILPKGSSFDDLTQDDINLVMSHVNSYLRPKFGDKSPCEVFSFLHGEEVLKKLGIQHITPKNVILKPSLLVK